MVVNLDFKILQIKPTELKGQFAPSVIDTESLKTEGLSYAEADFTVFRK